MLGRVTAFALDGVASRRVTVEADIRSGLPAFTIVGLADKAVREARERVRAAIVNSGFEFPSRRITVNLAPAYLRKVGPSFDFPLALSVLVASAQVEVDPASPAAFAGELALNGRLRPVRGALAIAEGARRERLARLFVPRPCAPEAALVDGVEVAGVESLVEAVEVLSGRSPVPEIPRTEAGPPSDPGLDLADVRGHSALIPAVEVAAAGGHNLFLHGPPGTGKTMLARRLPTILPPLSQEEALEVTRIRSVAGLHTGGGLVTERPFRAPHHQISPSALVGGGATPMPGEMTLAHNGVLFLDELSEFGRHALEALRQPLEDGHVTIARSQRVAVYPTRCMVVAASNPCPCGLGGEACSCSAADVARHARRLSGPLLDRIDITIPVDRPSADALRTDTAPSSATVRRRVVAARERQFERFAGLAVTCNARMTPRMVTELARVTPEALEPLYRAHDARRLSARGHHRVLRVARTVADLDGSLTVEPRHIATALTFRSETAADPVAA